MAMRQYVPKPALAQPPTLLVRERRLARLLRLAGRQHGRHLLVNQVDHLQGADHHLEFDQLALRVPLEHVHAAHVDAVDLHLKLQHRVARPDDLSNGWPSA
jgi:hypothetical protein